MSKNSRNVAVIAVIAGALLPAAAARAQWYSSAPARPASNFPYAAQQQTYAIEVAPNTYVIRRPAETRSNPYIDCRNGCPRHSRHVAHRPVKQTAPASHRPHNHADRALIEELRKRGGVNTKTVNTVKVVRDPPVVIEHKRYVDDPPRIIERQHLVEDEPAVIPVPAPVPASQPHRRRHVTVEQPGVIPRDGANEGKLRVIKADAEVTILGPDRMTIRLTRKARGSKAKARAD